MWSSSLCNGLSWWLRWYRFTCNVGDSGLIRFGTPFHYSRLENPHAQRNLVDYSPMGLQRVRHDWVTSTHIYKTLCIRSYIYMSGYIHIYVYINTYITYIYILLIYMQIYKTLLPSSNFAEQLELTIITE